MKNRTNAGHILLEDVFLFFPPFVLQDHAKKDDSGGTILRPEHQQKQRPHLFDGSSFQSDEVRESEDQGHHYGSKHTKCKSFMGFVYSSKVLAHCVI